jgi:hypothetical protein
LKVLGLAPQFGQPSAPGAERIDRVKAAEELQRLRIVKTSPSEDPLSSESQDASKEGMDQQTRAGLRRLAQMIRKSHKKPAHQANIEPKRKRAMAAYTSVSNALHPHFHKGSFLDRLF